MVACTNSQQQQVKTVVEKDVEPALKEADKVCVDAEVLFGDADPVAIKIACKIIDISDKVIQTEIDLQNKAIKAMVAKSLAKSGVHAEAPCPNPASKP
jgi:hypothetical protein